MGTAFRCTVVGSYPRVGGGPGMQRLRRAITKRDRGEIEDAELRAVEVDVIQEVVREQASAGVDVVTDGHVTWYDPASHLASGLEGLEVGPLLRYFDTNTYYRQPSAVGAIRWRGPITVDDWKAAAAASPVPVKAVLPGPWTLACLSSGPESSRATFAEQASEALGREVEALAEAGATHIQIDEPCFTRTGIPRGYGGFAERLVAGRRGATTTLFAYFGGADGILEDLLSLPFDVVGLDLVEGASTLEPLRRVRVEKPIAFGLLDARNTRLEDPPAVAGRVLAYRDRIPLERSFLSPSNGLEFLPRRKARAKLEVLVAATRIVREAS